MKPAFVLVNAIFSFLWLVAPATMAAETNGPTPATATGGSADRVKAAPFGANAPQAAPSNTENAKTINNAYRTPATEPQVSGAVGGATTQMDAGKGTAPTPGPAALRGKPTKEQKSGSSPAEPASVRGKPTKEQKTAS